MRNNVVNLLVIKSELSLMPLMDATAVHLLLRDILEALADDDYLYAQCVMVDLIRTLIKERDVLRTNHSVPADMDKLTRLCKEIQTIRLQNDSLIRAMTEAECFLSQFKSILTATLIATGLSLPFAIFLWIAK